MNAGEFGVAATVVGSILLCIWIVRDSRRHNREMRETQEQERDAVIERCTFAPQTRRALRIE